MFRTNPFKYLAMLLAFIVGLAVFTWMADWFYSIWDAPIHFTYFSKLNFFIAFVLLFLLSLMIITFFTSNI